MTKEQYLEMCAALGSEPKEDEIPVEYHDLDELTKLALMVYDALQDTRDNFNNCYTGKNLVGFLDVFSLFDIDTCDYREIYNVIKYLDSLKIEASRDAAAKAQNKKPPG